MMRKLFTHDSAAGAGTSSDQLTESTPKPTPAANTPPAPAPAGPPVPAADTVNAGKITEETELLRVQLAEKNKRIEELDATVKDREKVICDNQDAHHRYRKSVEEGDGAPVKVRVGMFRK